MNSLMGNHLYLAWHYLRHHKLTAAVLITAITVTIYLPIGLQLLIQHAETHFRSRADSTPLVIGPKGSPLELVMGSTYFDVPNLEKMKYGEFTRLKSEAIGTFIPVHSAMAVGDTRIVGTLTTYLEARDLRIERGDTWNLMGECLLGSRVAEKLKLNLGDKIPVTRSSAFELKEPPLRLNVCGILASTESPDDDAIFVTLKTAWILDGFGHGHAKEAQHGTPQAQLFTDITAENESSFHFHGKQEEYPITSIIAFPDDRKSETLLLGRYFSPDNTLQIVKPAAVMDAALKKVFMIRSYMIAIIGIVSLVTFLTIGLVIILTIRLRAMELQTVAKIGGSRFHVASLISSQILIIVSVSLVASITMAVATKVYGPTLIRALFL